MTVPHAAAQGRDPRAIVAIIPPFVTAASVLPDGYNRGVRCVDVGSFDPCVHLYENISQSHSSARQDYYSIDIISMLLFSVCWLSFIVGINDSYEIIILLRVYHTDCFHRFRFRIPIHSSHVSALCMAN